MCCAGAAALGPGRCTCWEPEYDKPQSQDLQQGPMLVRASACVDCAFGPDSPERAGDPDYMHSSPGGLEEIAYGAQPFLCHQGMRRRLRVVHPSGVVVPSPPSHYEPPVRNVMAWKADGSPADVCAGWAARQR